MEMIDKSAVLLYIERVLNSYDPNEITSGRYALADLRDFINTLEVKEVGLDIGSPGGDMCVKTVWDGDKMVSSEV